MIKEFRINVRRELDKRGLDDGQFAKMSGINRSSLSEILASKRGFKEEHLLWAAQTLKLPPCALLLDADTHCVRIEENADMREKIPQIQEMLFLMQIPEIYGIMWGAFCQAKLMHREHIAEFIKKKREPRRT